MRTRSITTASSAVPNPGTLCDPPRTAMARPSSRAKFTAATTSSTPAQRTMTRGRRSIIALYTLRASSYAASSGVMISPRTWSRSCAIVAVAILSSSRAVVRSFLLRTGLERNPPRSESGDPCERCLTRKPHLDDGRARVVRQQRAALWRALFGSVDRRLSSDFGSVSQPTSRADPPRLRADPRRDWARRRRGSRGPPARPRSLATCRAGRAPRPTP